MTENEFNEYMRPWLELNSEQMDVRWQKKDKLESLGFNPYRNDLKPKNKALELVSLYENSSKEELENNAKGIVYSLAGRVLMVRDFGKAAFLAFDDGTSQFQIYLKRDELDEASCEHFKLLDYGDIVYAQGEVFRTNKGELALKAHQFAILTKSLRPLPEKFHGLSDTELCYRMRYVDMIMNVESRNKLKLRSDIVRMIREFFQGRDYIEVETPMLHTVVGGAAAKPFMTHHNALSQDMNLRIAPELYLKRLIVGGFPRVFELNRCFRNEGVSIRHNPEFTSIEFYQAYATYEDMMELTEELFNGLVKKLYGVEEIPFGERTISLKRPFRRATLRDLVKETLHLSDADLLDAEKLKNLLRSKVEKPGTLKDLSLDRLVVLCFEEFVESSLINPTFVCEYPVEVSPLSRRSDTNPQYVDRFELYMNGWEMANAFSELNHPRDQLERFAEQAGMKAAGDEEACDVDYDFVRALEYGMPPTAGQGIGIDRLCMVLTNSPSIRDVILFPQLKKEVYFAGEGDSEGEHLSHNSSR